MRFVFLFLLFSMLFSAGCVTIVLDEQGDAAGTVDKIPVEVVEGRAEKSIPVEVVKKQAETIEEAALEPVAEEIVELETIDAAPEPAQKPVDKDELTLEQQAYTDARLAELRDKSQRRGDAVPLDDFDSRELLQILEFKTEKTGASKGKVSEILFVVRNYGQTTLDLNAQLLVETLITNPDFPRVERTKFDLKEIPPGMKIEKRAYLGFEFHPLGYNRNYQLRLLDNSFPPREVKSVSGIYRID